MSQFWVALFGIVAGASGYLAITFWFQPILRYRDLKYQVASDLVFYANAIELQKLDGSIRPDTLERKECNRRLAAALISIYSQLPFPYQRWLVYLKEDPQKASWELIRLSNTDTREEANDCISHVKTALRLPSFRQVSLGACS